MDAQNTGQISSWKSLLSEAGRAADPHQCNLLDRADLADLVVRLRELVEELVMERDQLLSEREDLSERLTRSGRAPMFAGLNHAAGDGSALGPIS